MFIRRWDIPSAPSRRTTSSVATSAIVLTMRTWGSGVIRRFLLRCGFEFRHRINGCLRRVYPETIHQYLRNLPCVVVANRLPFRAPKTLRKAK